MVTQIRFFCFQFMLIFKYAKEGTLLVEGLRKIADCVDVSAEGVGGAKSFFEAKVCIAIKPVLSCMYINA